MEHKPKKSPEELADKRTGPSATHYGGKYYLKAKGTRPRSMMDRSAYQPTPDTVAIGALKVC